MGTISNYRFTSVALLTLAIFAAVSGSITEPLPLSWRQALGYAPTDLLQLDLHRLFTSLCVTAGAGKFIASFLMLAFAVGCCERMLGTWPTLRFFLVSHITILLFMSCVFLLAGRVSGTPESLALATGRDIGPSAGYYGCLGIVLASQPPRWRFSSLLVVMIVLAIRLWMSSEHVLEEPTVVSADLAHILAVPFGWAAHATGLCVGRERQKQA